MIVFLLLLVPVFYMAEKIRGTTACDCSYIVEIEIYEYQKKADAEFSERVVMVSDSFVVRNVFGESGIYDIKAKQHFEIKVTALENKAGIDIKDFIKMLVHTESGNSFYIGGWDEVEAKIYRNEPEDAFLWDSP